MKKVIEFVSPVVGVLWGAVCIIGSGAVIMPVGAFILLCHMFGLHKPANKAAAWLHKRTTRFTA